MLIYISKTKRIDLSRNNVNQQKQLPATALDELNDKDQKKYLKCGRNLNQLYPFEAPIWVLETLEERNPETPRAECIFCKSNPLNHYQGVYYIKAEEHKELYESIGSCYEIMHRLRIQKRELDGLVDELRRLHSKINNLPEMDK